MTITVLDLEIFQNEGCDVVWTPGARVNFCDFVKNIATDVRLNWKASK